VTPATIGQSVRQIFAVAIVVAVCWPQVAAAQSDAVAGELQYIIQDGIATPGAEDDDERLIQVFTYYEDRSFKPLFVRDDGPKAKAKVLLEHLRNADEDGLDPGSYGIAEIEKRLADPSPVNLAETEILFARAMIDYGRDLTAGRVEPRKVNKSLFVYPHGPGPLTLLEGAEQADDLGSFIATLAPQTPNYARLKEALVAHRTIAARGGWPKLPLAETLKPGMEDTRVATLRTLLETTGDLAPGAHASGIYHGEIVEAVKRFQYRHGLEEDGVIGPTTLAELNVPVEERIVQIELNMERRRWMKDDLGKRYIFVNLADQYLKVVENDKTIHTALLVVGKPYHSTPVFSEEMTYLELNPFWNVPPSIATNEYLPKLRRNPGVLERENIRVLAAGNSEVSPWAVDWASISGRFPYFLRQDPGPKNALGRIKFMFPNQFNVYIHDTPSKSLFAKASRIFSHGCMRVQYPEQLAEVLLKEQGWTKAKLEQAIATGERRVLKLKRTIPVYVTYLTAFANKDGSVHFRRDVYGRDKTLAAALQQARS
jgi:murein L,D-transpeptidase YcbB/YkuD